MGASEKIGEGGGGKEGKIPPSPLANFFARSHFSRGQIIENHLSPTETLAAQARSGATDWSRRSVKEVMGKCVAKVIKQDVIDASGSIQVCAGHKSGSEAAIHAMREIFEHDSSDAVLLVDASNALNRAAALHNIRVLCSSIATYAINTYRRALAPLHCWRTGTEII